MSSLTISMLCMGPKGIIAALSDDSVTSSARPPTYNDLLECITGSDEDAIMRSISIDIWLEEQHLDSYRVYRYGMKELYEIVVK